MCIARVNCGIKQSKNSHKNPKNLENTDRHGVILSSKKIGNHPKTTGPPFSSLSQPPLPPSARTHLWFRSAGAHHHTAPSSPERFGNRVASMNVEVCKSKLSSRGSITPTFTVPRLGFAVASISSKAAECRGGKAACTKELHVLQLAGTCRMAADPNASVISISLTRINIDAEAGFAAAPPFTPSRGQLEDVPPDGASRQWLQDETSRTGFWHEFC